MAAVRSRSRVRTRIVLIYFLLVFIAMIIVSVFLTNRLEDYRLNELRDKLSGTINESNMLITLGKYDDLESNSELIQKSLDEYWSVGFQEEFSVLDKDFLIVASTNPSLVGKSALDVFDTGILVNTFMTEARGESETVTSGNIKVRNFSYAIPRQDGIGGVHGVVYVRADIAGLELFLKQSRIIFVEATGIALIVTVILGFLIARSITEPIKDVTRTVERMSAGDFSREVEVRSDDEIGQLGEMFNILRERLDFTLTEISNEKNKLETILEYMADGLIAVDFSGTIIHVNPAAKVMLKEPADSELKGTPYDELIGKASEDLKFENIKEGCRFEGGQSVLNYDGGTFAARYDRFKDESGKDVGIILIMHDITQRQKLEDMQKDFVANVSHELKTPLTTIKSYTETLLDGTLEDCDTAEKFLEIVDMEADRMNRLVKDLLQLSRLDHKQEKWNKKELNVIQLLNTASAKVAMMAAQKNQILHKEYDSDDFIPLYADRDGIEQVLMNLLSNAFKYTPDGGNITLRASREDGHVRITVIDDGIGMSEEEAGRIFERFYRVDKGRSRAMGGTGLGLAITKQIVEEHGGKISVASSEGKGTKVVIEFPQGSQPESAF